MEFFRHSKGIVALLMALVLNTSHASVDYQALATLGNTEPYHGQTNQSTRHHLLRLGMSVLPDGAGASPSFTLGQSWVSQTSQLDVAFTATFKDSSGKETSFIQLPEVTYKQFLAPYQVGTFYLGGGVGFGMYEIENTIGTPVTEREFEGIYVNGVLGYVVDRTSSFNPHIELKLHQGLVASTHKASAPTIPTINFGIIF